MNVVGYSGLHQSVEFKRRHFPDLYEREYRIVQGFDSAAALVTDAGVVAAAAEERFAREKATGRFPLDAINYCLREGGLSLRDIDVIAHAFDYEPHRSAFEETDYGRQQFADVFSADVQRRNLEHFFNGQGLAEKFVPVPHHVAHAASAYYPSGFDEALIVVSDGMGEVHSATIAHGRGRDIEVLRTIPSLHSLGILYGVFTLYLGFDFGSDEYKVMGLAPYGDPHLFYGSMSDLIRLESDGGYTIPILAANRTQLEKETHRGVLSALVDRFGPQRAPDDPITEHHRAIAAALQAALQTCQLHVLRHFQRMTGARNLCLAGGVALNCSANGVIKRSRMFRNVFVQPAAGDDGAALGAALVARERAGVESPRCSIAMPLLGPAFPEADVCAALAGRTEVVSTPAHDRDALCSAIAAELDHGRIVGWFQGRMEYGPRALGSRSLLADPRDPTMRDRLNARVKKREGFRPFAPIVTAEAASTYFEIAAGDEAAYAHMLFVTAVRAAYRHQLPAITHVDGSARVQTVSRDRSPLLWMLLRAFEARTGCPILLNTSFNVKGQPIVCTPLEAIGTFVTAGLDVLVLGDHIVRATAGRSAADDVPRALEVG